MPRLLALAAVALCMACTVGCVQRRMTIRTNPPGALVYVDNYEIGTTPVSTDFIYYGRRRIRLVKEGFETVTIEQPIPAPWYQWFPLDFVSENLVPGEIRDERVLNYQMVPQRMISPQEILNQAEELRRNAQTAAVPASVPPGAPVAPYAAPAGGAVPYRGPTVANPYGTAPAGTVPSGAAPPYTPPGAAPGTFPPSGAYPGGEYPRGAYPGGAVAPPALPQPQLAPSTRVAPLSPGGATFAPPSQPPAGR